ncbi:MAG: protein arginine kinase [Clostridia bacterium]|nr:protein arginine kinase [Clostridia bacterium]
MKKWYIEKGDQGDVVLSTRVRLARNLEAYPFPNRLDVQSKKKICAEISDAVLSDGSNTFHRIDMASLTPSQAVSLAERHLISPEFTTDREGRALLLTDDESVSIMLCEEDHIRLQVMQAGLALEQAYDIADKIDTMLDKRLQYAFDERIGYLTQCPTNLGTAMRASVMLHLPALDATGRISSLAATVSKLGLVIRGAYGEGSSARGSIYQISNQITLGITEQAAIDNLRAITLQIVSQERAAEEQLLQNESEIDKIWRARGVLSSARLLSADEFMELISLVRMGAARQIFPLSMEKINELIVRMQPATINAASGQNLSPAKRDAVRAEAVRTALLTQGDEEV